MNHLDQAGVRTKKVLSPELIAAVKTADVNVVRSLLEAGAPATARDELSAQTALMIAAGRGSEDVVALLVSAGADVNAIDGKAGAAAIHKAAQGGHLAIVRKLVASGAFINLLCATTGHTPLIEAIWFGRDQIVDYLLSHDARIDVKTSYGFSLADHVTYAKRVNQSGPAQQALGRIEKLVAQRQTSDAVLQEQPLLVAALSGDASAVDACLRTAPDTEVRYPVVGSFSDGHTALLIAARDGHAAMVDVLIHAQADVNARDPIFGAVPLHKATYNGYEEITRSLAHAPHIDLNAQGPANGYTPLHDALWHGFRGCAEILVNAGARVDIVAYDRRLPIDIAGTVLPAGDPLLSQLQ